MRKTAFHRSREPKRADHRVRFRSEIKFDEAVTGIATGELVEALKQGEYAIYFRGYKANEGIIEADVRSVSPEQLTIIAQRIAEELNKEPRP